MYNWRDVSELCKCSKSYAYELIRKLQEILKKEYPNAIIIPGKIPKQYFNRFVLGIEKDENLDTTPKK